MSNVKVIFELEEKTIRDPVNLGTLSSSEESLVFPLKIKHNSNKPIRECKIYVSPKRNNYQGTASSLSDYEKLIWFADNYPGTGLSIYQYYEVFGEVSGADSGRVVDLTRTETLDFFKDSFMEILDGPAAGERIRILSYDTKNNVFYIQGDFSTSITGAKYKIEIERNEFIKTRQGTSKDYAIDVLYNGGIINRFEEASFSIKLSLPPYIKMAGINELEFNVSYIPEE